MLKASDIRFYKTLPDNSEKEKVKALTEHKEAIKLVAQQYLLDTGKKIKEDFDDIGYQNYVMSLGSAFDAFSEEDMKKIVSLVKFMDLYENYSVNEKLAKYEKKIAQEVKLSDEETAEVLSLLPIDLNEPSTADTRVATSSEESTRAMSIQTVFPNGYNNIAARDYAWDWWDTRNPVYSTYYAEKNVPACEPEDECWSDCANFVSQALYTGGMKFKYGATYTSDTSWHFGGLVPSYTWGGATNFYRHWKTRAGVAASAADLQTGDAVSYDAGQNGNPDHTALITVNTGSTSAHKTLTYHSTDTYATALSNWYNAGFKVYGYEIDKAVN